MEKMTYAKIWLVHKPLDALELRVWHRPGLTTDITTFKIDFTRLWYDIYALLAHTEAYLNPTLVDEVEDVVMSKIFGKTMPPPTSWWVICTYAPQVCFTLCVIFVSIMHWGKLAIFFVGVG